MIVEVDCKTAGVDWLTITECKGGNTEAGIEGALEKLYRSKAKQSSQSKVRFGGYKGIGDDNGLKIGTRARGSLEDIMMVCSSGRAHEIVMDIARLKHVRVTRLDLQMTCEVRSPTPLARIMREETLAKREKGERAHRRAMVYYSSDSGDTLYIGDRSSKSRYIRVYDKGAQEGGEPGVLWRFEIEYHRSTTGSVMERLREEGFSTETVRAIVTTEMAAVGLKLWGERGEAAPKVEKTEQNIEASLDWLEWCVKPVFVKIAKAGRLDDALERVGMARKGVETVTQKGGEI